MILILKAFYQNDRMLFYVKKFFKNILRHRNIEKEFFRQSMCQKSLIQNEYDGRFK